MNPPLPPIDAAYWISNRLSCSQLLLILSYVFLKSRLPSSIGDYRQLEDIIHREPNEWQPHVGEDYLLGAYQKDWLALDSAEHAAWEGIRESMIQQYPLISNISSEDLREYLIYLLSRIEQISAQGCNTLWRPPRTRSIALDRRACLTLIGLSLEVTSVPLCNNEWHSIDDMRSQLQKSPLFPNEIPLSQLESGCDSLDMLLSHEEDRLVGAHHRKLVHIQRGL